MSITESFNMYDYINLDMFEDDVSEDHSEATEASQASAYNNGSHTLLEADILHVDSDASSFQQAMQQAIEAHLQATLPYDGVLFQDTTNAPQAATEREVTIDARANVPREGEEKIADGADAHDEAGADESGPSEDKPTCEALSSDDDSSIPQATPSTPESTVPYIARSQDSQQPSSLEETTTRRWSNKENAPLAHPPVEERSAPARRLIQPRVASRRQRHEEQPVAGPSSVTLDDLESYESTGSDSEEEPAAPTKRPRSTNKEVSSLQTAARRASLCRLDGGSCNHELVNAPRKNKGHIKEAHPSLLPLTAGTAASTTGPLYHKGTLLSDAKIREFVTRDALACTWAAAPGAARCGAVFAGSAAQGSLARHVEEIHWERKFACTQCTPSRPFGSLRTLQKHRRDKHSGTGGVNVPGDVEVDEEDGEAEQEEEQPPTKRRRMK